MGKRIKEMREELRMTQAELARKLGFGQAYIANIEAGERSVSPETIVKLTEIFGCTAGYILGTEVV